MSVNEIKRQISEELKKKGYDRSQISVESKIVGIYDYVVVVIKNESILEEEIEGLLDRFHGVSIDNYPGRSFSDFCRVRTFQNRNRIQEN